MRKGRVRANTHMKGPGMSEGVRPKGPASSPFTVPVSQSSSLGRSDSHLRNLHPGWEDCWRNLTPPATPPLQPDARPHRGLPGSRPPAVHQLALFLISTAPTQTFSVFLRVLPSSLLGDAPFCCYQEIIK